MPNGSVLRIPPTNLLLLASKQEPYNNKKAYLFTKNIVEVSEKKVHQNRPAGRKKDKSERVARLGRKTREEIVKWNQMTALIFHTGGVGETSDIPGLPSGRSRSIDTCRLTVASASTNQTAEGTSPTPPTIVCHHS